MYPIIVEWGNFVLPAWHTFYVLAAIAAYFVMQSLGKRTVSPVDSQHLATLFSVSYIAGYFGARLLSILVEEHFTTGLDIFTRLFELGPMTFYGGAIGAMVAGSIYAFLRKLSFWHLLDICMPAGLIALAIGRIGCFLNGDDYGLALPAKLQVDPPFWAVAFPNHDELIYRYPVQLLSAFGVGVFAIFLIWQFRSLHNRFGPGFIGTLAIGYYACFRFLIEFLRGDPRGSVLGGLLSTSQFISIWVMTIMIAVYLAKKWRPHHEI